MSRDELVSEIITIVGAVSETDIAKIKRNLSDVMLLIQMRSSEEVLISDLNANSLARIKDECARRYRK